MAACLDSRTSRQINAPVAQINSSLLFKGKLQGVCESSGKQRRQYEANYDADRGDGTPYVRCGSNVAITDGRR
jgi:hypothetical protein